MENFWEKNPPECVSGMQTTGAAWTSGEEARSEQARLQRETRILKKKRSSPERRPTDQAGSGLGGERL